MTVDAGSPLYGPAEAPGPLWSRGVRRPGPNRFGYDPSRPRLEPVHRTDNAHHINRAGFDNLGNPETLRRREELFTQLARRKKRGTREQPIRREQGRYADAALEVRTQDMRADAFESMMRLLRWCVYQCDWRTGKVGLWIDGKIKYQSRASIGERAGFPVRVDDKGRVRAYQEDARFEDLIAAGYVWRHEEERTKRVALKVTRLGFTVAGVQKLREQYGQQEQKKKIEAERQAEREERARRDQVAPELAVTVASLANARRNDTSDYVTPGPEGARRRGWPGDDPPDK